MRRVLRWLGLGLVVLVLIAAGLYATRSDPWGPIAGRALSGAVVTESVTDWSFTDEHSLIAIEVRPEAPHSVTTICFSHEGALYVPAQSGSAKSWTYYAMADPRVRVKVGDRIYPGLATRVRDAAVVETMREAAARKYDFASADGRVLDDIWVFRIDSAVDVAARPGVRGFAIGR